jgi:DNA invertase Pin-like site-specific DNA recombinase
MAGERAALYARVSTKRQGEEFDKVSVPDQLAELRALAAERGHQVVGEFADTGYSRDTVDRPQLRKLLAFAEAGSVDVVLAVVDRLAVGNALGYLR